ncbi:GTP cyclohydrolase [Apibacter muscae]|nr:GTP cyclohydrolase [Apibacter muscae]
MMKIQIKEVASIKDLKKFINFPILLYKNCPNYVPSLIKEELEVLDKNKNPVFEHAQATYYLAYKEGKIVGRIAAIINTYEVEKLHKKKVRFGWFDVIDDIAVTQALIEKVKAVGLDNNLHYIEGPVGFSNMEKAGLLTEGFDRLSTMITLYNHSYYKDHLESLGFKEEKVWVENFFKVPEELPEKVTRFSKLLQEKKNFKALRFSNKKEMEPYVRPMFNLLIETYNALESFVPFSEKQINFYTQKYLQILNPNFVTCILDENQEICAFAVTSPSYAKGLQKSRGKLFPWGWYHLLKASKNFDTAEYILIGVHPKYQKKGITAIIFTEIFHTLKKYNIRFVETNPQLVDNLNVQLLWSDYNPITHKKRKTYIKTIC